jgi:cytochrome d ubiquinol oxidase subunit I
VEFRIPYVLSLLATHDPFGRVVGLKDIPKDERPPIVLIFYSFRIMVVTGTLMILAGLLGAWAWRQGRLTPERAGAQRRLLTFFVWLAPFSMVSVWTGWIMREVGRQPWILYGMLKTSDMASPLTARTVGLSLSMFAVAAVGLTWLFLAFSRRLLKEGPERDAPPDRCEIGRRS